MEQSQIDHALAAKQAEIRTKLSQMEDEVLRTFDSITGDGRWVSIARTQIQLGFMAAKRGLYEGKRVGDP